MTLPKRKKRFTRHSGVEQTLRDSDMSYPLKAEILPVGIFQTDIDRRCEYVVFADISTFPVKMRNRSLVLGIARDITERKHLQQSLEYLATPDPLIGLPNRSLFFDRLNYVLPVAKRYNGSLAVFFFDLDDFMVVNDTMGHEKGIYC